MERKAKATPRADDFLDQQQGQPENREKAGTQQKAFIHSITKVSIQHSARKHFRLKGCSTVGIAGGVNESIPQVRHKPWPDSLRQQRISAQKSGRSQVAS